MGVASFFYYDNTQPHSLPSTRPERSLNGLMRRNRLIVNRSQPNWTPLGELGGTYSTLYHYNQKSWGIFEEKEEGEEECVLTLLYDSKIL